MTRSKLTNGSPDGTVLNRRQTLQFLSCLGVAGSLNGASCAAAQGAHRHADTAAAPRILSAEEFALLSQLTELIIPKTDTAGAIEAGVPEYIETELALSASRAVYADNLRLLFSDGLRWVEEKSQATFNKAFLQLAQKQQYSLLEPLCAAADAGESVGRSVQFMRALKDMTAAGYYTSQQGLMDELGYRGNTPQSGFAECDPRPLK